MRRLRSFLSACTAILIITCHTQCVRSSKNSTLLNGLTEEVQVIRDSIGINHIYAKNQHDLFFAQGYCAAKDRLFQFEIWRRQAAGTLSEVFGKKMLDRDIGARLFKYRGNLSKELNHYHPEGEAIIRAYVDGINRYIEEILQHPEDLPLEFKVLNILPEKWTPEIVVSRHNAWLGNVQYELDYGRAVALAGVDAVKDAMWFHPKDPDLALDPTITTELLSQDILKYYNAFREPMTFSTEDVVPEFRAKELSTHLSKKENQQVPEGSNNWVIDGTKSKSGYPILANDPHRRIAVPSLRYAVHLVAPGWNVIGGGEPTIPGVSIGHNEFGAWGLTIFEDDSEDLLVYDLNPDNLTQYRYDDAWVDMIKIPEDVAVKNNDTIHADLYYTHDGPVTLIDSARQKAFAIRCAWLEPGGAPYLASLRMDQASSWDEFLDACAYSHIPGENMIWADRDGNIGWQAVGIAPIRKNFSGLVPVPGDGRYPWDGYLPIREKPHLENPKKHFIETANENITPENYEHWDAIAFEWEDAFRGKRIKDVLEQKNELTVDDMMQLQTDYLSTPAQMLLPYLRAMHFKNTLVDSAARKIEKWTPLLSSESIEAGIYVAWENKIRERALEKFVDPRIQELITLQLTRILEWIENPALKFRAKPELRDTFLKDCFESAIEDLSNTYGRKMTRWKYGQVNYKHITIEHPLAKILNDSLRNLLNAGPAIRGGYGYTVGYTSSYLNQSAGASFRMIMDLSDWDDAVGTNTPGQSGNPESPYYKNLFKPWSKDQFFPFYYSKDRIESISTEHLSFLPNG